MEREYFESHSSHLCQSRTQLWCPVCGAAAGKSCTPMGGLRFTGHDNCASGILLRPTQIITGDFESLPVRRGNTKVRVN